MSWIVVALVALTALGAALPDEQQTASSTTTTSTSTTVSTTTTTTRPPTTTTTRPTTTTRRATTTTTTTPTTTTAPPTTTTAPPPPTTGPPPPSEASAALAQLATLPVKGRAPKTGYDRDQFGQAWSDSVAVEGGHNGCDTRNDILRRDLRSTTIKPGTNGCVVLSGMLADPYTARSIPFFRGPQSADVQVDHVVALSDAWQKGAQQVSADQREDLANDPRNLQATDGPTNQQKGDGDAATWLPPNRSYRCTYVARQVAVKAHYRLWVTPAEKDAITRVLTGCGGSAPAPPAPAQPPVTAPPTTSPPDTAPPAAVPPPQIREIVHPGAFCAPAGARGVTKKGTPMVCRTSPTDTRNRWRSG